MPPYTVDLCKILKVKVQRVTVVEFGMYNRSGDGVGCFEIKVGANAAQIFRRLQSANYLYIKYTNDTNINQNQLCTQKPRMCEPLSLAQIVPLDDQLAVFSRLPAVVRQRLPPPPLWEQLDGGGGR